LLRPHDIVSCFSIFKQRQLDFRARRNIVLTNLVQQPSVADPEHLGRAPSIPTGLFKGSADSTYLRRRTEYLPVRTQIQ
jgi:hypothetical protein